MGRNADGKSFLQSILGKLRRQNLADEPVPLSAPLAMLDRLHAGEQTDYGLYLRPPGGGAVARNGILSVDLEELLVQAFHPLPMITLDESGTGPQDAPLPDEAIMLLARRARVLCLAPTNNPRFVQRLRLIKKSGALGRSIFVMPENGTLGIIDWPGIWPAAKDALAALDIELSGYTPGGWLFRIDKEGKAVTFRPIVNPNPEKIARALEGICVEMD